MTRLRHAPNPQPHPTTDLEDHDGWLTQLAQLPAGDYQAIADTIRNLDPDQLRNLKHQRNRTNQETL